MPKNRVFRKKLKEVNNMYGNPNQINYSSSSSGFTFDPLQWLVLDGPFWTIDLINSCQKIIRSHPHRKKGFAEIEKNNYETAICAFKRANEIHCEAENYLNLASCYLQLGQNENALKNANDAVSIAPDIKEPYYLRARIYIALHRYQDAIQDLDHSINKLTIRFLQPSSSNEFEKRALAKVQLGRFEEAIPDALRAIELDPNNSSAFKTLIQAKKCLDQPNDVIKIALHAITLFPNESLFYSEISYAKNKLGQYQAAAQYAQKAIGINNQDKFAFYNLVFAKIKLGQYEEALQYAPKAIELNPKQSILFSHIAYAKNQLNQYEEAIQYAKRAIQLDSKNADAYYNLCLANNRLGKYQDTIRIYYCKR